MPRLQHWDYKAPFFYMVTLKCLPGLPPLSVLDASTKWGVQEGNPITECIRQTIETFQERTPSVEKIFPYAIMPDHLHMLLKIANIPERKSLMDLVDLLRRLIRNAYQKQTRLNTPLWEERWHDLIVKKQNQLPNFHYYILNNPQMALLRRENREHFHCYRARITIGDWMRIH